MSKTYSHSAASNRRPNPATPRRPDPRQHADPLGYEHPWPSMAEYAKRLALLSDASRTRHSYYRAMRLVHEHFGCDPALISQDQLRDYILHVKTVKRWKPKTIRQPLACARLFFVDMLGHTDWTLFSQVKTKDHDELPPVLTREQVRALLLHVRLRRYRIPLKLIYCCGLRLSECLGLTVHDILGNENKLFIRASKKQDKGQVNYPQSSAVSPPNESRSSRAVRSFAVGLVLGSRAFVEAVFARCRERFGLKRKDGARVMKGFGELRVMRDLRLRPTEYARKGGRARGLLVAGKTCRLAQFRNSAG